MKTTMDSKAFVADRLNTYVPNKAIRDNLSQKTIIGFMGVSGIGKSTFMKAVASNHSQFGIARGFTTRPLAPKERAEHRHMPNTPQTKEWLAEKIRRGKLVQYMVHPNGFVYGTDERDFRTPFTFLDCTAKGWSKTRQLPVAKAVGIVLVAEPEVWVPQYRNRFKRTDADTAKTRLQEDVFTMKWCLEDDATAWVSNGSRRKPVQGSMHPTAQEIIDISQEACEPNAANRAIGERLLRAITQELE